MRVGWLQQLESVERMEKRPNCEMAQEGGVMGGVGGGGRELTSCGR